ncbi:MAG: hypothetical protein EBU31_02065 [Proteobacteria bacterium]|jgi:hypothetical protein|nr:hypothetical protein [Pseudomonadota bacterium]
MNLREAKILLTNTHRAAYLAGDRADAAEMISGPGVGKSSLFDNYCGDLCKLLGRPVGQMVNMLANLSSPDVRGFMLPSKQPDGRLISIFSDSPLMPRHSNIVVFEPDGSEALGYKVWPLGTWPADRPMPDVGVSALDEFAQAEDETKKPAADYVLKGQVGTNQLPLGWRVIAASNRMSDRSGVVRPLMHIINRRMEMFITGSYDVWNEDFVQKLPPNKRPHYLTVTFAAQNPHIVFKEATPPDGKAFCSPRTLVAADRVLRAIRSPDQDGRDALPIDNLAREAAAGWLGEADASQFFVHCKYSEQIPTVGQVVADPMEAKLPPSMDAQMVCAHMLSHAVTAKNARQLVRYAMRLNIEMQALMFRNVTQQPHTAGEVLNTPEFGAWVSKNADLIVASRM